MKLSATAVTPGHVLLGEVKMEQNWILAWIVKMHIKEIISVSPDSFMFAYKKGH